MQESLKVHGLAKIWLLAAWVAVRAAYFSLSLFGTVMQQFVLDGRDTNSTMFPEQRIYIFQPGFLPALYDPVLCYLGMYQVVKPLDLGTCIITVPLSREQEDSNEYYVICLCLQFSGFCISCLASLLLCVFGILLTSGIKLPPIAPSYIIIRSTAHTINVHGIFDHCYIAAQRQNFLISVAQQAAALAHE